MKRFSMPVLCVAMAAMAFSAFAEKRVDHDGKQEEGTKMPVKWSDLPPVIREAIQKGVGGGKIEGVVVEEEDGEKTYEASVDVAGGEYVVEVAQDGRIIKKELAEMKVELNECPQIVQDALKANAKGHPMKDVAMEDKDGVIIYVADVVIDGQGIELQVSEDGKLLAQEKDNEATDGPSTKSNEQDEKDEQSEKKD